MASAAKTGAGRRLPRMGHRRASRVEASVGPLAGVERVEVVVVGAGFAGIGAAAALRRAGRDVRVIDRAGGVGGTWRQNTYPGVACDVPAPLYSFAAHPSSDWSAPYAPGAEIRAYLEGVARREGIDVETDAPLEDARWRADASAWQLRIGGAAARTVLAETLVLACGRLTEPAVPDIEGLASFPGEIVHTARWRDDLDVRGRRVAVIGSGASAIQLVPRLVADGADVTIFQRTAPWILPRPAAPDAGADPARARAEAFANAEAGFAARSGEPGASLRAREASLAHLAAQVADPALRARLTPTYPFGCSRVLLSDDYYPAVAASVLEPSALVGVEGDALVAASGRRHPADIVVFATGFADAGRAFAPLVHGEDGSLDEHWAGGMRTHASTVVAGFPNLFVLGGPGAALGHNSAVLVLEEQIAYAVRALDHRDARGGAPLRVRPDAEAAWTADIARRAAGTPWTSGACRNGYIDARSGEVGVLWPGTAASFAERLRACDGSEFDTVRTEEPAWAERQRA